MFLRFYKKTTSSFFNEAFVLYEACIIKLKIVFFFWVNCLSFLLVSILLLIPVRILKL